MKAMEICHPRCVEILKTFIQTLPKRAAFRAIDVAGGDGRLSRSLLLKLYQRVDLFDACPVAVKKAKAAMVNQPNFGYAEQATMQGFRWHYNYSAIFMVWCVGYLENTDLIALLRRAKVKLDQGIDRISRGTLPGSLIIILDNVLGRGEVSELIKGQRVRSTAELESIYAEAGLIIHKRSGAKKMPEPYREVFVWALY